MRSLNNMEETKALECIRREVAEIQKGHETQLIVLEVLVYPHTNKRAHTRVVSNLLILSCV